MTSPSDISSPVFAVPRQGANGLTLAPGASCAGGSFPRDREPWTEEERAGFCLLWRDRAWLLVDISATIRRSIRTVRSEARRMKLGPRPFRGKTDRRRWTEDERASLREMASRGMSDKEIGNALGRRRSVIKSQRNAMRLRLKPPIPQPKPAAKPIDVNELLRRGISPQTVALITRGAR